MLCPGVAVHSSLGKPTVAGKCSSEAFLGPPDRFILRSVAEGCLLSHDPVGSLGRHRRGQRLYRRGKSNQSMVIPLVRRRLEV